jgi:hypothetical protein
LIDLFEVFGYLHNMNFSFHLCKEYFRRVSTENEKVISFKMIKDRKALILEKVIIQYLIYSQKGIITRQKTMERRMFLPLGNRNFSHWNHLSLWCLFYYSATKACFISAIIFVLEHLQFIQFERELIYLCVVSMFIYVRVITIFFKQYDPLMPFENFSSGLLFNSWSETIVIIYLTFFFLY